MTGSNEERKKFFRVLGDDLGRMPASKQTVW